MPKKFPVPRRDNNFERLSPLIPLVKAKITTFLSEHPDIRCNRAEITDERGVWSFNLDMWYVSRKEEDDVVAEDSTSRRTSLTADEKSVLGNFSQSLVYQINEIETAVLTETNLGMYTYRLYLTGTAPPQL